ncbi:MAG: GldG family protein [Planctomycetota bacterium]|nr:GldG family protein [Planctomycetota bacterium]MDI6786914.1 GldG family protein [Planctomycetota bacterium]
MSNDEIQMTNNQTSRPAEGLPAEVPQGGTKEGWGRKQKTLTWLNVLAMVLIAVGILVGVNYVSKRRYFRIDCTFRQQYSLSSKTKEILKQLKEPLIIYTFFVQPQDQATYDIQQKMADLLEEYKIHSNGKILVEAIQPAASPEKVEILQKKFRLETIAPNDMILRSGDNQKNVNLVETYERDYGQYGRPTGIKAFKGEESLTSAIMSIIKTQKSIIYFVKGHGEGDIGNSGPDGYATFIYHLQRENIESKTISLLELTQIPDDCSVMVLLGPKSIVSAPERNLINNYLKKGGRVLLAIDPLTEHGLSEFLQEWGVRLLDGIVLDSEKCIALFGIKNVTIIIAQDYPPHKITDKMKTEESFLPIACGVQSISPSPMNIGTTELLRSSGHSWLETDIEAFEKGRARFDKDSDIKGPIGLGVAVTKKEGDKESRLVVLGDSDMVRNQFIDSNSLMGFGRVDLLLNSIRWLAGQEEFITIEPKRVESSRIDLTSQRVTFLWIFSLLLVPAVGAVAGIVMWLMRRK